MTRFALNMDAYRQGLAENAGAHLDSVEILSWRDFCADNNSQTTLACRLPYAENISNFGCLVEMTFRVSVPRYFEEKARKGLESFPTWAEQRGLPSVCR